MSAVGPRRLVTSIPSDSRIYNGKCVKVIDGDTFYIMMDCGFDIYAEQKIRLLGVQCDEITGADREKGLEAKRFTESQILNKQVVVEVWHRKKSFDRWIGKISYADNLGSIRDLGAEIIKSKNGKTHIYSEAVPLFDQLKSEFNKTRNVFLQQSWRDRTPEETEEEIVNLECIYRVYSLNLMNNPDYFQPDPVKPVEPGE